ncbi:MAG: peptide-methionine (S)-S-oxide reductase [Paracoccaceae bacterium]
MAACSQTGTGVGPLNQVGFGGGCHWCTEAVFQALKGVVAVRQGFIRSDPPHDSWSEAVEVDFDPDGISLEDLVAVHLATHASQSAHKLRGKYRSAVYVLTPGHAASVETALAGIASDTGAVFVTQALPHRGFRPSDDRFQNYHARDPLRPFCQTYIDPKLAGLRKDFARLIKVSPVRGDAVRSCPPSGPGLAARRECA